MKPMKKYETGEAPPDIIDAIIQLKMNNFIAALNADNNSVNAIHKSSGMTALMLCVYGQLSDYIEIILSSYGQYIDFEHTDKEGDNLLSIAFSTMNADIIRNVREAYRIQAAHIVHNWPEP